MSSEAVAVTGMGAVSALGVTAELVAAIGVDHAGHELTALVAREPHVTARLVSIPARKTSVKTRFIAGNQQLLRADHEATDPIAEADIRSLLEDATAAMAAAPLPSMTTQRRVEGMR